MTTLLTGPMTARQRRALRPRRTSRTLAIVGGAGLALFGFLAVFGSAIAPYDAGERAGRPFLEPSADHLLGTDDVGHDILSELIGGARVSLLIGLAAAAISIVGGGLLGAFSGYRRGVIDAALMRTVDFALVVPAIPLIIVLASYLERGMRSQILVVAVLLWAEPARIVRSQVLSVRERTHVLAARTFGAKGPYLLRRHVVPAVTPLLVAQFVRVVSIAILFEVALSFVGLGDPVRRSWGSMIQFATDRGAFLTGAWKWWILPPGLCVALVVCSFAFIGLGIEERVDRRLARSATT
jgi:peptide/nickel transport system permease protein